MDLCLGSSIGPSPFHWHSKAWLAESHKLIQPRWQLCLIERCYIFPNELWRPCHLPTLTQIVLPVPKRVRGGRCWRVARISHSYFSKPRRVTLLNKQCERGNRLCNSLLNMLNPFVSWDRTAFLRPTFSTMQTKHTERTCDRTASYLLPLTWALTEVHANTCST